MIESFMIRNIACKKNNENTSKPYFFSNNMRIEPTSSLIRMNNRNPWVGTEPDSQLSFDIWRRNNALSPQNRVVPLQDYHSLRRAKNDRSLTIFWK